MGKTNSVQIVPEQPQHAAVIAELLDACFGTDRNARAVYRLRDGRMPDTRLSFVAIDSRGQVIGTIRYWPVWVDLQSQVNTNSTGRPAVLLGPIAVATHYQNLGLGEKIIRHSLVIAKNYYPTVILVGPLEYYQRFGFTDESFVQIPDLEAGKAVLSL